MNAAVWIFLQACVWGIACGMAYSLLRLACRIFSVGRCPEFWLDGFFFLGVSLYVFRFSLRLLDGRLRFFILAGWLLGGILARFTIGEFFFSAGLMIQDFLHKAGRSIRRFTLKKNTSFSHND